MIIPGSLENRDLTKCGIAAFTLATCLGAVVLAPGDPAPAIAALDLAGHKREVRWGDHALTLVSFWATWCAPCRDEMTALQALQDRRGLQAFVVVGLLLDRASDSEARAFAADLGIRYPLMRADTAMDAAWGGIRTFPTSFLVSREGKILRRYIGAAKVMREAMANDIGALVEGRPMGTLPMPDNPGTVPGP